MNLEFTLFLVAAFQLLLLQTCLCHPLFSYIFGEETASPTSLNEIGPIPTDPGITENIITELNADATATTSSTAGQVPSVQEAPIQMKEPLRLEPTKMNCTQPKLGNIGFPWALNTIALAARLLNGGVRGTKKLIEGSNDLTIQALGGARRLGNEVFKGAQGAIDKGADRTLNRVSGWMDATNSYRKGLSGTTAKPQDRGHSITITTNSDAPVQSFNDFMSNYLPSGVGTGSLPGITSIDLSKLW